MGSSRECQKAPSHTCFPCVVESNKADCLCTRGEGRSAYKGSVNAFECFGFCCKPEEELVNSDSIVFLGLNLNSVSYRATLSEQREENVRNCARQFHLGKTISFRLYLRLLGLVASIIAVVPLGLLFMRGFQRWVASLKLNPSRHKGDGCTTRDGCISTSLARDPVICFPTGKPYPPHTVQNRITEGEGAPNSPVMAREDMDSRDSPTAVFASMASSSAQRYPLSGRGENFSSTSGEVESLGLACERSNLNALGLPQNVISTIQSARTDSTRSLYEEKWKRFETWCQERYHFFHQCQTSLPSFRRY